jgi:hypothetical protein
LIAIDNGYGAISRIDYRSAKENGTSLHNVPYPEIVVTAEGVTDGVGKLRSAVTTYAYGGAELIFDSAEDRFIFPGYQRTVELRATDNEISDGNVAVITDTYGLSLFDPSMDAATRFKRYLKVGRVSDVTVLSGGLGTDPWRLTTGDLNHNTFRKSGAHYDWDARLLPPGPAPAGNEQCMDMMFPYDFPLSRQFAIFNASDECTRHGFVFQTTGSSWHGEPGTAEPFSSRDTVKTNTQVKSVDVSGGRLRSRSSMILRAATMTSACRRYTPRLRARTNACYPRPRRAQ